MGCSLPGSSVPGILQARILEWVAISFSRGSFPPRDRTLVCYLAGGFSTTEPVEGKLRFLTLTRLLPTGRAGTQGKVPLGTWILDGAELPHSLVGLKRSKRQKTCLNKHPLQAVPQPTLAHHPQGGFTENLPHTNRTLRPPCGLGPPARLGQSRGHRPPGRREHTGWSRWRSPAAGSVAPKSRVPSSPR